MRTRSVRSLRFFDKRLAIGAAAPSVAPVPMMHVRVARLPQAEEGESGTAQTPVFLAHR